MAIAALEKLAKRGEVKKGQRVVVLSTASGLKFTDFKVRYHEDAIASGPSAQPNRPVTLPAEYEAVKRTVLGVLDA